MNPTKVETVFKMMKYPIRSNLSKRQLQKTARKFELSKITVPKFVRPHLSASDSILITKVVSKCWSQRNTVI